MKQTVRQTYVSRQEWLRDPDRKRSYSIADRRPVEGAKLEGGQDLMMEMVRQHLREAAAERDQEDEEFLEDDEFELEKADHVVSDYQLAELAAEMEAMLDEESPDPLPPLENRGEADPVGEADASSGNEATEPNSTST